jgi:glycine cleavage system aminomethyltransferase T
VWEQLSAAGRDFGLLPYGVTAMQTLRVEKGLPLYGNDVNERYTPFHVGLDRWVKFEKREFVGRDALLRVQERGPDERWVGLILDSEVAADPGVVYRRVQPAIDRDRLSDEVLHHCGHCHQRKRRSPPHDDRFKLAQFAEA